MIKVIKIFLLLAISVSLKSQGYQIPTIKDTSDWSGSIVYIDPDAVGGGDGSIGSPYNSIPSIQSNTAYLVKAGTTVDQGQISFTDVTNVYVGKYGSGDMPALYSFSSQVVLVQGTSYNITFDSLEIYRPGNGGAGSVFNINSSNGAGGVTLSYCYLHGVDTRDGTYPQYIIIGSGDDFTMYHCEVAYAALDATYSSGGANYTIVSSYWHHSCMSGWGGDLIQLEYAGIDYGYIANNVLDRQHFYSKFALIWNGTLATNSYNVVEWNTIIVNANYNDLGETEGGSGVRWLAGTNNKLRKNLFNTWSGIPGIDGYDAHLNQTYPYGVRDNVEFGPGLISNQSLTDATNLDLASASAYSSLLAGSYADSVTKYNGTPYGSDLDTSDFWATGSTPAYNPCTANPMSVSAIIGNDTNNRAVGYIDITVSGGNGNFTYDWSNSETTQDINNLLSGDYNVTIIDDSLCNITRYYTVDEIDTTSSADYLTIDTVYANIEDGTNVATNMLDGNYGTRWSNNLDSARAVFVLDNIYNIDSVKIAFHRDTLRNTFFSIYTSIDSSNWTSVLSDTSNGNTLLLQPFNVSDSKARYIMLEGYGNNEPTATEWTSITEFRAIGDTASGCIPITHSTSVANCDSTQNNGAITLTASGGSGTLLFSWDDGPTTQNRSNLTSGTYSYTITDDSLCTASGSTTVYRDYTIVGDSISDSSYVNLVYVSGAITRFNVEGWVSLDVDETDTIDIGHGRRIWISYSNGTDAYNLDYTSSIVNDSLVIGGHRVNDGLDSTNYLLKGFDPNKTYGIRFIGEERGSQAGGAETRTVLSVAGDSAFTNDRDSVATLSGIVPDIDSTFTVNFTSLVADANLHTMVIYNEDKSSAGSSTVTYPIDATITQTNVSCYGGSSGSIITNSVFNGTGPYTHSWSNDSTVSLITGLIAGVYSDTITDAVDSSVVKTYIITEPDSIYYEYEVENPVNGSNDGQIKVFNISGGSGVYTILWSTGETSLVINPSFVDSTYWFQITDGNGCTTDTVFITLIDDTCAPITLGSYVIFPDVNSQSNGGILPDLNTVEGYVDYFSFIWSNGTSGSDVSQLSAGSYYLLIIGADGCKSDTIDFFVPAVTVSSLDTIQWDVDITPASWVNKINAGINVLNLSIEPDVDTLVVPSTWQTWYGSTNDYIQEFPSIVNDTLIYGTDNLGNFVEKANAAIKLTLE